MAVGIFHFAEQIQVGGHHDPWAKMQRRRERRLMRDVVRHEAHSNLSLAMGLLVNGCGDGALLEVHGHFRKEVRGD